MLLRSTPPGLVYSLGRQLYVSLTNAAIGLPLLKSRGPTFSLGKDSGFSPLPPGYTPTPQNVLDNVQPLLDNGDEFDPRVTFAGAGDPLSELGLLCEAAELIKR